MSQVNLFYYIRPLTLDFEPFIEYDEGYYCVIFFVEIENDLFCACE